MQRVLPSVNGTLATWPDVWQNAVASLARRATEARRKGDRPLERHQVPRDRHAYGMRAREIRYHRETRVASTADGWGAPNNFGAGKLNAGRAVSAAWPSPTVLVSGPHPVKPNQLCNWAGVVSGGVQPYSYQWRVNGVTQSTDPVFEFPTGTANFTLQFRVTDQMGMTGIGTTTIAVNSSAPNWFVCS